MFRRLLKIAVFAASGIACLSMGVSGARADFFDDLFGGGSSYSGGGRTNVRFSPARSSSVSAIGGSIT
jgi:hypothetical protein